MIDKNLFYMADVIDADDPENTGRIKVKVPGFTDELSDDDLPWYPVYVNPNSSSNAFSRLPNVGSRVFVQFPYGDIYNGLVVFALPSIPSAS